MPKQRVHLVNSRCAKLALPSSREFRMQIILLVAMTVNPALLMGQQPENTRLESSVRSNSLRSNPLSQDVRESARNGTDAAWMDVIRLQSLPSHVDPPVVTAMSVSPAGDYLAAAGDDHAIRIVNLSTGKTIATLIGHLDWVQSLEFSPNGLQLASCGNDGTLRVWSLGPSPKMLATRSVPHALMTLAYLNDQCIYTAGFSNRIYRFDASQKELAVVHICDCRDIRSIVASPDRTRIAFGGRDGVLRVREVNPVGQAEPLEHGQAGHSMTEKEIVVLLHSDRIRTLQFSDDGNQVTSVGEDRRIVHYDLASRSIVGKTEIGGGKLLGLCQLEPHLFAIASSDNTIRIFSDKDQTVHARLVGHDGSVSILKRTKTQLISGSFDTTIRIWDIDRATSSIDNQGRYKHPVAAQFEDSGAGADVK